MIRPSQTRTEPQAIIADDPNFDPAAVGPKDESPYPEVRCAVSNTDDPKMPASTLRAWVIGLFFAIVFPGANQFFSFRYPSINMSWVCLLLFFPSSVAESIALCKFKFVTLFLSLLMGKLWARYVPKASIFGISLNPGPFTVKEHVIISIMSGIGATPAYAVSITPVSQIISTRSHQFSSGRSHRCPEGVLQPTSKLWLSVSCLVSSITSIHVSDRLSKADQWVLVMSTQLIGFSIGGLCKRILVAPQSVIWPANLVTAALFNTLHSQETSGTHSWGGVSRGRFFAYVFVGYTLYSQYFSLGKYRCHCLMLIGCRRTRLLTFLSLYRSLKFFLGMLDSPQQSCGQSIVRCHTRHVHGYPHI